jgi:hypothetical protein
MNHQVGQHYTKLNIFNHPVFLDWFQNIPSSKKEVILEPFAGSNQIIYLLQELQLIQSFCSYDILPKDKNVQYLDTFQSFPKGYSTCITNPPFLAKSIAGKKKLNIDFGHYHNLYEKSLSLCIQNCEYVGIILPDSFLLNLNFSERLFAIISLNYKAIFEKTEQPVCLALFSPKISKDFPVYNKNEFLGYYFEKQKELSEFLDTENHHLPIFFHRINGNIGLHSLDATQNNKKMRFDSPNSILDKDVGLHARFRTRILILNPHFNPLTTHENYQFINLLNQTLLEYRQKSKDLFLTSFRGLREDGQYRKRLDFLTAKKIIAKSYKKFFNLQ